VVRPFNLNEPPPRRTRQKRQAASKLGGNKLSITIKVVGDMEQTLTPTITKLTDTERVTTDEKGKEGMLVRVKDK
jgi:hypothetical protein